MAVIQTLEGLLTPDLWFHYDVANDVLHLRLTAHRDTPTLGEETDEGLIVHRDETSGEPVALTVVSFWERFGQGPLPDSFIQIQSRIEPFAAQLAA